MNIYVSGSSSGLGKLLLKNILDSKKFIEKKKIISIKIYFYSFCIFRKK